MMNLPVGWAMEPLAKLGTWTGGGTPSTSNAEFWTNGTIPWVSPKDMKQRRIAVAQDSITEAAVKSSATNLIAENSLMLVTRSGILRHSLPVATNTKPVTLNQDMKALAPLEGLELDFLYFAFRRFEREILHGCCKGGTTVQSIEASRLMAFEIPIPPTAEQRRIVAKIEELFSELDKGIENLKQARAQLAVYRQALLKHAFEGKLTADWRATHAAQLESAAQLLARIRSTCREAWTGREKFVEAVPPDATKLQPLPAVWTWASIGQLRVFSLYGPRFSSDDYADDGYVVLRTSDISESGKVDTSKAPRLRLSPGDFERYRARRGDLLVTRTGSLGTLAIFDDDVDAIPGAYLIQFRLATDPITTRYLFHFLKSPVGQTYLAGKGAGVGRPNLNAPSIEALAVPFPPLEEQQRIVAELDQQLSAAATLESDIAMNLQRAEALRQSILKKAFAGELVPQDPADEPAAALLARIRAERAAQAAAPKPKKPRKSP